MSAASTPAQKAGTIVAEASGVPPEDLTGRSRYARNVAFGWGGQIVRIIAGFIIPRLLSDRLGQTSLGIWDFSWSIVSYFALLQFGLSGSVSRYVARFRATSDRASLTRFISTSSLFLNVAGVLIAITTVCTVIFVLPLFGGKLGGELDAARWTLFFLGADLAVSAAMSIYVGVVVGCHRSDLHNTMIAGGNVASMLGMIAAVTMGGGLAAVAFVQFASSTAVNLWRRRCAHRICPELSIDYKTADWPTFIEQLKFSSKNVIPYVAQLISINSVSLIIAGFLGPAALAVFLRPRSLVSNIKVLAAKFAMPLVSTASALQARTEFDGLRGTLISSSRVLAFVTLPLIVTLAVFGNEVIRLWMGADFVYPGLMEVFAIAAFATVVQEPSWNILIGLHRHGRPSMMQIASAAASATGLLVSLNAFPGSLVAAAIAVVSPQILVEGLVVPAFACRHLQIPLTAFYRRVLGKPFLFNFPFLVCAIAARLVYQDHRIWAGVIMGAGIVSLLVIYAAWVVPESLTLKIKKVLRLNPRLAGKTSPPPTAATTQMQICPK